MPSINYPGTLKYISIYWFIILPVWLLIQRIEVQIMSPHKGTAHMGWPNKKQGRKKFQLGKHPRMMMCACSNEPGRKSSRPIVPAISCRSLDGLVLTRQKSCCRMVRRRDSRMSRGSERGHRTMAHQQIGTCPRCRRRHVPLPQWRP